ncbi:hypothetical protein GYMLUDRAFT_265538 [Collybiopsis luxurians FD-317 M1]|uniref:Unplaced genomic scaffold GYMLUscaffold_99, whole genome shotgun sequence n=1 Tax=Collybiopsis luxurians FD-317 M1 TaxID=944289 RepID=A0A0D0BCJ7_9AGAR|nr:hypothetical protein GYMLUDRAFT_265538 [Collybiopsis luxurians FD-317 M1]
MTAKTAISQTSPSRSNSSDSDDFTSPLIPSNFVATSPTTTAGLESLTESELYVRLLAPTKHGYPLWHSTSDRNLPLEYRQTGVEIGDVVVLDDFGGFSYLFNACRSADNPVNARRVPPNFSPLEIDPGNNNNNNNIVIRKPKAFGPGSHIVSNSSFFRKATIPSPCTFRFWTSKVPRQVGGGLVYTSSAPKGALLILPEGSTRVDLRHQHRTQLYNYATKFARSWYDYLNGPSDTSRQDPRQPQFGRQLQIPSNAIYLITGYDKARAYGAACFAHEYPQNDSQFGDPEVELELKPILPRSFRSTPRYTFSRVAYAAPTVGMDDVFERQTLCLFLRGFKIAVRETDEMESSSSSPSSPISNTGNSMGEALIELVPMPERNQTYHPSDAINRWILRNHSEVDVAITHDDDWAFVIRDVSALNSSKIHNPAFFDVCMLPHTLGRRRNPIRRGTGPAC